MIWLVIAFFVLAIFIPILVQMVKDVNEATMFAVEYMKDYKKEDKKYRDNFS